MKCHWCGFESDNPEDFEEDFTLHRGYWCYECDGFTYYKGKEDFSSYNLMLEDKGVEVRHNNKIKFNKHLSPLRYPGGKSKIVNLIYDHMDTNKSTFIEVFCGGASVSLALLEAGVIEQVVLNDLDYGIYSLFNLILYDTEWLVQAILNMVPSKESFFKYRSIIFNNYRNVSEREAGLAMLIVNRMAFSGIVKANPMSNIDARWNPIKLVERIKWISNQRNRITLLNKPAEEVIENYYWSSNNTLFVDPPYYIKGKVLYNLHYTEKQHMDLAFLLNTLYCSYRVYESFSVNKELLGLL